MNRVEQCREKEDKCENMIPSKLEHQRTEAECQLEVEKKKGGREGDMKYKEEKDKEEKAVGQQEGRYEGRGGTGGKKSKERNKWCHNKQQSLDGMNCLCFYQSAEREHY